MSLLDQIIGPHQVVVFDLDGTLVEGMPYEELLEKVAALCGTTFEALMQYYKNEWTNIEEAQAYHESLAGESAGRVRELYAEFARAKASPQVLPGTVEALEACQVAGKHTLCYTRGDTALQQAVIDSAGLRAYFDDIIVTPKKTSAEVQERLLPCIPSYESFVMIGDSLEQDMAPVAGLAAVRVWISGSKANSYLEPPTHVDDDIIVVERVSYLL